MKAVSSVSHLGGQDFNRQIVEFFLKKFDSKGISDRTMQGLRVTSERAKIQLSTVSDASVGISSQWNRF